MPKIGVFVVDDHAIVREGLRSILTADAELSVVGEAGDGEEACAKAAALQPDVVIMDLSMPGLNGIETTRRLRVVSPMSQVIALTAHEEIAYVREALGAGARGYVLKRAVLHDLLRAIHIVVKGGLFLDRELARHRPSPDVQDVPRPERDLSIREAQVASLAARGHSNAEVATALAISVKTVEAHKTRLMAKLGLRNRAQLVRYAVFRGWLKD